MFLTSLPTTESVPGNCLLILTSKPNDLFLVVGEVHNERKPETSETPHWLTIPEAALFTGMAIIGAIGTGKMSRCMCPFAEQILTYRASDKNKRIGGTVLEVKGDLCHKVREILNRHGRPRTGSH
jgi:hypothetical protein